MRARDALDDRQAESRAAGAAARVIEARERPFHALELVGGNAGPAVAHFDRHARAVARGLDLDRIAGMAQRVVDQVGDRAAHRHAREDERRHPAGLEAHLAVDTPVVLDELVEHLVQLVLALLLVGAARELEELADDGVHLVDIRDHCLAVARLRIHLQGEPQARERRAQVVRDAGEHHGTLALDALQVAGHAVESDGDAAQLARPFFGERLVRLAAAQAAAGELERGERPGDHRGDEEGARQGDGEQRRAPAEPLQAERRLEALPGQHRPELVLVDEEADPEAFEAVALGGEARLLAERFAHPGHDLLQQRIVGQGLELLAGGGGEDAQPLGLVQVDQQLAAQEGVGVDQRGARQVDRAHRLLRQLARARLALIDAVDLEGGEDGGDDQQRDQQERPPKERHLPASASGTNT